MSAARDPVDLALDAYDEARRAATVKAHGGSAEPISETARAWIRPMMAAALAAATAPRPMEEAPEGVEVLLFARWTMPGELAVPEFSWKPAIFDTSDPFGTLESDEKDAILSRRVGRDPRGWLPMPAPIEEPKT